MKAITKLTAAKLSCKCRSFWILILLLSNLTIAVAQNVRTITGKLTDANTGKPIAGASVVLKGTTTGTSTDENGNYTLKVPANTNAGTLIFTNIGFIAKEQAFTGEKIGNVSLTPDAKALNDIVVIGYGTAKKSDLTGSVSQVKADEIRASAPTTFDQALQGRSAGVQVTQISGKPGGETSIRIRGTSSITAGNEPLYVVDGLLISSDGRDMSTGVTLGPSLSPLSSINPNDIESIEILKDASATAMYGSRGANGVVLITTKKGKSGRGTISFDASYGSQEISHKLQVLNGPQFGNFVNEAKMNGGQTPVYVNPKNLPTTDWQGELFRKAPMQSYQLSMSGGNEKTKYSLSGSYFDQDGIITNSDFKRYTFRANLDQKITERLSAGLTTTYSNVASNGVLTTAGDGTIVPGIITSALLFNPILPVYNSKIPGGYTYENDRGKTLGNPVAEAKEYNSFSTISRILGNVFLKYKIADGLEFKTSFGIDNYNSKENSFGPNFLKRTQASHGEAGIGMMQGLTWLNENILSYTKDLRGGKDNISAVAGFTTQKFHNDGLVQYVFDFDDNRTGWHNLSAGKNPQKPSSPESQWSMVSYLARVNYSLGDKYLFTLTGRTDGSSKFAEGNKYGFFPSGAFAWRVINEEFMKEQKIFSDLKVRTSYGIIGNQAIPPYQSLALVGPFGEGTFNTANSEPFTGQEPTSYPNKDLKWETTAQFDLGVDMSFFKSRLNITADYYNKKTSDLLYPTPIPYTTGFVTTLLNVGNITNNGFDLDIRSINIKNKNFRWNTALTFSVNKNKITKLNIDRDVYLAGGQILRVGQPIGTFYGLVFDGIFQSDEEAASSPVLVGQEATSPDPASRAKAGDRKYKNMSDVNGKVVIDDNDRVILGYAQPKFTWGLNNSFSYKNWDLSFFFQGSQGNKMANMNTLNLQNFTGENNVIAEAALNRWTPENHSNKYPRALSYGSKDVGIFSSNVVEDASYIRLKSLLLAYNFNAQMLKKSGIQNIRVYASATNLLTITKYTGYDPEANTYGQNTTIVGVDNGGYPQAKVYTLGLGVQF